MTYKFKTIILTIIIFASSFFGIIFWTSTYIGVDEKAFRLYQDSNLNMAYAFTEELEKHAPSAKYPLYQGYILRKKGNLDQSTAALKKALKSNKTGQTTALLTEIHLNLCLNAYLKQDRDLFQESLKTLWQIKQSNPNMQSVCQYTDLFRGIEAFLDKDYEKALSLFQKHQSFSNLSPWMKSSFVNEFNTMWLNKHIIHCLIEESNFSQAYQKLHELEACAINDDNLDVIYFLRALCHFRQAEIKNGDQKSSCHELAIAEISKIKARAALSDDIKKITLKLQKELLQNARNNQLTDYSYNLKTFCTLTTDADKDEISLKICSEIESLLIDKKLNESLNVLMNTPRNFRVKLLYTLNKNMEKALEKGDCTLLEVYIDLLKPLEENKEIEPRNFNNHVIDYTFFCLKNKNNMSEKGIVLLNFWSQSEKNPEIKLKAAKKLVSIATIIWLEDENYLQAINLFKKALELTIADDKYLILGQLEKTVSDLYKRAQAKDAVEQYFHVLEAVKTLKLNTVNIYDVQEKKQQLDDAELFFLKGHYKIASQKASFVLKLEPENDRANRIMGLIAYDFKNYSRAYHHLKMIKFKDEAVLDILKSQDPARSQPKLN
jgi:hypothetical protein